MSATSSTAFGWDNPQFDNSQYFKFTKEGDQISGVIVGISTNTFPAKGNPDEPDYQPPATYPVLVLDTATGEREVTISNVDLLAKTKALAPQVGDWYDAAYVATAGKKRIFIVQVKKAPAEPLMGATNAVHYERTIPQPPAGATEAIPF